MPSPPPSPEHKAVAQTQDVEDSAPKLYTAPGYQPKIIPDEHPETIEADVELTANLPLDTPVLELIHLKIHSLKDLQLQKFQNLEVVCLRQNLIENINEIKHLNADKLEELDFYDNRIDHMSSHLNELVNLHTLDLSFNRIKHIRNIENLQKLQNLYLIQNRISEISNVSMLHNLTNLELGGNKITEISDELLKMPQLEKLWLGKNSITKLENLDSLKNLKILSIQSNKIAKIEGLDKCENLEEFYISHNKLTKIEGLENNLKLTVFDFTGNKVSKLENMTHLVELTDLWASDNLIDDFQNVFDQLKNCTKLDTVYLERNPVQRENQTSYRRKLKLGLPKSLTKIDATYL